MADVTRAVWRKSSYSSGNGGNCVEVASNLPGAVAVRDSKNMTGLELQFTSQAWTAFVAGIKRGEFDL
jgi:hypothetical protein